MFTPDRASAAIADYNQGRRRRCFSLDEVAKDLGLRPRPAVGALAWVDEIIVAAQSRGLSGVARTGQLAS